MGYREYLLVIVYLCVLNHLYSAPLSPQEPEFCTENTLLKFKNGNEYFYDYSTQTTLWINDVSDESKSNVELKAKVIVRSVSQCTYLLRIEDATISGPTINAQAASNLADMLNSKPVQFRLNSDGEIDSIVDFSENDQPWSRNIKRGILSSLQLKNPEDLRSAKPGSDEGKKSAVVYETDVLGRCRTTYSTDDNLKSAQIQLTKRKSLQRCTLNGNSKTSAIQYQPYKSLPEFHQGRLFIEEYKCKSTVKAGIIDSVECEEKSTYKVGSRGTKGVQAVVKQSLKYSSSTPGFNRMAVGPFESLEINFEYTDKTVDDLEYRNFDINRFLSEICSRANNKDGLDAEHSNNFRSLVNKIESYSEQQLLSLHSQAKSQCSLAGTTVLNALVFANTENSFQAVLKLFDRDEFAANLYITEYPLLTALARNPNPSLNFLKKLKDYIATKDARFPYLKKLILVYSALIKAHCENSNDCDESTLNDLNSILQPNLGSDCSNGKKELTAVTLKAIGNIGHLSDPSILINCAKNQQNSAEVRVSAVQAFRRFSCDKLEKVAGLPDILRNRENDAELRINAFQALIRCSENENYQNAAKNVIPTFLDEETDAQVLTYIIDYAKEHGITTLLNPILSNPRLKEKFSVNFKELSWNNYKYRYSVLRDGAIEVDTSVIFDTKKAFLPRSIRFNTTFHMFGMSINFMDLTIRMEGLDEILKLAVINKLRGENLIKKFVESPEALIDVLQAIASKLQNNAEKPYFSVLARVYGADVFFSELDDASELRKMAEFIRSPRDKLLYAKVQAVRNMFLIDSRVRQPLLNGFEFNTFMDSSLSLVISKDSTKQDSAAKRSYDINNFYSSSVSINKRFEIQLNSENKVALKKKVLLNTRLNLDLSGTKGNGSYSYNIALTPKQEIPLVVLDGRFYKLVSNKDYREITQFDDQSYTSDRCTSGNFLESVGVDVCVSVKRPSSGTLLSILKPDNDDASIIDSDDQDDDNEDDDDDDNIKPRFILAGPYHYEIKLKNPDLLKALIISAEIKKDSESTSIKGKLQAQKANNQIQDKLDLVYLRKRSDTNLKIDRSITLDLNRANSRDSRFKFAAEFSYSKQKLIYLNFNLDNKIIKDFKTYLQFKRDKTNADNVLPVYKIEAGLDSKVIDNKHRRLAINLIPDGKNINGDLLIEYSGVSSNFALVKVIEGRLNLRSLSDSKVDYEVDLDIQTKRPSKLSITGRVDFSLLNSNSTLFIDYSNNNVKLSEPASINLGHSIDVSTPDSLSYIQFNVKVPLADRKINYGVKTLFQASLNPMSLKYVEAQIRTTKNAGSEPYIVYVGKQSSNEGPVETNTYLAGFKNFNLDLSQRADVSALARALVNLDKEKDPVLKSLELKFSRKRDQEAKSRQSTITGQKNGKQFLSIQASRQGSLKSLRETPNELPKQTLSAGLNIKYKDYSGSIDAKLNLENSVSRGKHAYSLDFKTDGLIKALLKIVSLSSKVQVDKNTKKVTAEYELIKIGEVKSLKIKTTNNQLRESGAAKEFDVSYEKVLASGKKSTSTGVVKYVFEDVKNFESTLDIPSFFSYKISMSNERSSPDQVIGTHEFYLKYSNLDVQPDERELKVLISNTTDRQLNNLKINIDAKKGAVGALNQLDQLAYLIDLKSDYTFMNTPSNQRIIYNADNKLAIKFKKFNIDLKLDNTMKSDLKTSEFSGEVDFDAKFPAIISDPGNLNFIKDNVKFTFNKATGTRTIKYSLETNNKAIGKYFKSLEGDYSRERVENTTKVLLNAKIIDPENNPKTLNLKVDRRNCIDEENELCSNTKVSLKQNIKPTFESRLAKGNTLDITDCKWESKYERTKSDDEFLLNFKKELECNGMDIFDNEILIRHDKAAKELELKVEASSDYLYEKRAYKLSVKRFTKKDGKLAITLVKPGLIDFSHSISYRRELDEITGDLSKGNYKIETSFGQRAKKSCEMTIESKTNYYAKMSCSLRTPKLPVEVTFGFLLNSKNHKEWLYGKRDVTLDINLPSTRQLRFNYVANRYTQVEAVDVNDKDHDDDDDLDNEREFNATLTYHWDFKKDQTKFIKINAKRDNREKGSSILTIDLNNYPKLDLLRIEIDRKRSFNQTELGLAVSYQLKNGKKNRLDIDATLASDLDTNAGKLEINLERPKFNIQYTNKFNKWNGRLQFLQIRLGKLIQMTVDKFDPDDRRISFELVSPDQSKFSADRTESIKNKVRTVISNLKSSNRQLSRLESSFDSDNNNLNLNLNGDYKLNVGFYNESLATLILTETKTRKNLALASLRIVDIEGINNLEFELHWNRFWSAIQQNILKGQDQANRADEDSRFNSYLGDVYSELVDDLKEAYDAIREDRRQAREDIKQCLLLHVDFYANFIPEKYRDVIKAKLQSIGQGYDSSNVKLEDLPLHKRIFHRYNRFASLLNRAYSFVKLRISARLAKYIPRLATIKYDSDSSVSGFDNNVLVTRPVYYSRNLYQFNAEYREYLRLISSRILSIKGNLARNLKSFSIKALINKYKYRPMDSYTMVGQVYNRRNIISFNGNSKLLRSKCTYLLAHELTKNRFTVILNNNNNNNQEPIITIHAYGLPPININAENAFIDGRKIALPYRLVNNEKGVEINVRKENLGVSYELNNDLLVKCHQDSRSCSIATTRFFTGKLNGLLGKSSYDLDSFNEDYWFLDRSCKPPTGSLKKPSEDAIKTCYSIFGKQRKSIFKNAFEVVKPTGWQKLCEAVLSFDSKAKCALMKSFVQYARIKNIDVDEPNDCYQCKVKDQSINVGQTAKNIQNPFESTSDYVFVFLPCDYKRNLADLTNNIGRLQSKISSNKYYFVKVDDEGASVYQPETSQVSNFDVKKAIEQISENQTVTDVPKEHIYQGLFLASTLFSNRLADSRHLVIVSCGNCIPYSSLSTLKLYKLLSKRNIIVSAWGDYPITDLEGSESEENVVGYGDEHIYLSNKITNQVDSDSLDGYNIEHKGDLCNRLAVKTNGNVFDINQLKKARVFEGVLQKINENKPKAKQTLQECERIETPFGDVADFSYDRKDLD